MIFYEKEIQALFDLYEEERLSEGEITQRAIGLVKEHNFDRDYMYDLNYVISERGYAFQFDIPDLERETFDANKYYDLCKNVSKSKEKTKALIDYLNAVNDPRLGLASIYMLKVRHLIALGYLPSDNEFISNHADLDIRSLLFLSFQANQKYENTLLEALSSFGIPYSTLDYMMFRLDIEYLLWTIERDDPKLGYRKVNTLKVVFLLAPKEYFIRMTKDGAISYYSPRYSKASKEYLRLIDQKAIDVIKGIWGEEGNKKDGTGYLVLYQILRKSKENN